MFYQIHMRGWRLVIKRAVDDLHLEKHAKRASGTGRWGERELKRDLREVKSNADTARYFIYDSNGVLVWLKLGSLDSFLDPNVIRRMCRVSNKRVFNFLHLKSRYE